MTRGLLYGAPSPEHVVDVVNAFLSNEAISWDGIADPTFGSEAIRLTVSLTDLPHRGSAEIVYRPLARFPATRGSGLVEVTRSFTGAPDVVGALLNAFGGLRQEAPGAPWVALDVLPPIQRADPFVAAFLHEAMASAMPQPSDGEALFSPAAYRVLTEECLAFLLTQEERIESCTEWMRDRGASAPARAGQDFWRDRSGQPGFTRPGRWPAAIAPLLATEASNYAPVCLNLGLDGHVHTGVMAPPPLPRIVEIPRLSA